MSSDDCMTLTGLGFENVHKTSFNSDSSLLAVATGSSVTICDVTTGTRKYLLTHTRDDLPIKKFKFNKYGSLLATSSYDGTTKIWLVGDPHESDPEFFGDVETGECLHTLTRVGRIEDVQFNEDSTLVATVSNNTVKIWSLSDGDCIRTIIGNGYNKKAKFNNDGTSVYTLGNDEMKTWDIETGECLYTFHLEHDERRSFNDDWTLLFTGTYNRPLKIWDTKTQQCLKTFDLPDEISVILLKISRDNSLAFAHLDASIVKIWDIQTGQCLHTFNHYKVWDVRFNYNNTLLIIGSEDGMAYVRSVRTGEILKTLEHNYLSTAKFSNDNNFIVTSSRNTVKIHTVNMGTKIKSANKK